ncbi:V-type proton ATPase subunit C 1-A isoform X2 [Phyllopteryx taeniolatus]|uniref:V-type proton ATPase subunit C 1-A isoform X2 n=1 Tax=Phyllopteryx taeniolatus TaxID=161469 RepID=UPI002AD4058F|nr:V-type proton ATPase subunit C 1-A isoform X2 [Phyllopteryx taeniolatus]
MTEFWLISAPGEKTCQQTWDKLMVATTRANNLSANTKFNIPDLKVGTLDVLVGLSDELAKLDTFVESVVKKVAQYMADVLEDSRDKVQENLLANGLDLVTYITRFQWDMAKYPIKQSLKNISEIVSKQATQIDNDLKARASAYNNLKGNLQNLERKNAGSLLTRSLADIVKKDDFVLDSEYLVTMLVVVPKASFVDWQKTYETLAEMVVPRSTKLLFEDNDSGLFSVTLFRKALDDFKHKARENKFTMRDFQYNEEEMKADKEEMTRLSTDKKKQFIRSSGELPGHAAAAQQEEHEEAAGGALRPVQAPGQQRRHHRRLHGHPRSEPEPAGVLPVRLLQDRLQPARLQSLEASSRSRRFYIPALFFPAHLCLTYVPH